MTIVTRFYRPKRARKRKAPVALSVPTIVPPKGKRTSSRGATKSDEPSRIVTARNPSRSARSFGDVPDMTPEEHKQRGDAADELFRRMKREIAEKLRGP